VSDPYEPLSSAEIVIDMSATSSEEAANRILGYLDAEGYLETPGAEPEHGDSDVALGDQPGAVSNERAAGPAIN